MIGLLLFILVVGGVGFYLFKKGVGASTSTTSKPSPQPTTPPVVVVGTPKIVKPGLEPYPVDKGQ